MTDEQRWMPDFARNFPCVFLGHDGHDGPRDLWAVHASDYSVADWSMTWNYSDMPGDYGSIGMAMMPEDHPPHWPAYECRRRWMVHPHYTPF